MEITLYRGTNKIITDGLAGGTYCTTDIEIAKEYARRKGGCNIYCFVGDHRHFYKDIFDEHHIASHFIPLEHLALLMIK